MLKHLADVQSSNKQRHYNGICQQSQRLSMPQEPAPKKRVDIFPGNFFQIFSGIFFHFFPYCFCFVFFALASAGSAFQALGAAERVGDEAPKPA